MATLAHASGADPSVIENMPELAAHRELDRLSALARRIHEGDPGAEDRMRNAVHRLKIAAPWLLNEANEIEQSFKTNCDCERAQTVIAAKDTNKATHGFLDDSGLSVLLAYVRSVMDEEATSLIIGLVATAFSMEQNLPGAVIDGDPSEHRDLDLLTRSQERFVMQRPNSSSTSAKLDTLVTMPVTLLRPFSGGVPLAGQPPTILNKGAGWQPGTNPWGSNKPWDTGKRPKFDPEIWDHRPFPPRASSAFDPRFTVRMACLKGLKEHLQPEPMPARLPVGAPVFWTTGIEGVESFPPCSSKAQLRIRGKGFGNAPATGVGVIVSTWDPLRRKEGCRPASVHTWSDIEVVVQLPQNPIGGVAAFADIAWIASYDAWVVRENARVEAVLMFASCGAREPPPGLIVREPWSGCPPPTQANSFKAGRPIVVGELSPMSGTLERWEAKTVRFSPGEPFRLLWTVVNADSVQLSDATVGISVLTGSSNVALSGAINLVAPTAPTVINLVITATNGCGRTVGIVRGVVVGPSFGNLAIQAVAPLPGGDIDIVLDGGGNETLVPNTRSIPLVAGKRTIVRLAWQNAVPQAPASMEVVATASIRANGVVLYPQRNTSLPIPPNSSLELRQTTNVENTFNFVLPATLASGNVKIVAYVEARSPGTGFGGDDLIYNASASAFLQFHQRRRIAFRYQRWGPTADSAGLPTDAPTDLACRRALLVDSALLPIPDPLIIPIPSRPAAVQNSRLVEDLFAMKAATPGASGQEEIWFVIGPANVGGVTLWAYPWTAATSTLRCVSAHEVCHMFGQSHLNLCGPTDGTPAGSFPDSGNVVPTGWDQWNNQPIVAATDLMSYCWNNPAWMSPTRWRTVFAGVGK